MAFVAELGAGPEARGGSDADDAVWRSVADLLAEDALALDHATILREGVAASRWASVLLR